MSVLPVFQLCSTLRQKSKPIVAFNETLKQLAADMIDTVKRHEALGLAAIQVGIPFQVIVISKLADTKVVSGKLVEGAEYVMCNPVILEQEGEQETVEACLSLAGVQGPVKRAAEVFVKYQDLDGAEHRIVAQGRLAVVIQHEIDHAVHGKMFIDYFPPVKRGMVIRKFEKMLQQHTRQERRREKQG